jgi:hypothetical protein
MPYYHGRRGGHAPGHIRDAFCEAVHAFMGWDGTGPEPTVALEVNYEPQPVTVSTMCGLVWNCSDVLPGELFRWLRDDLPDDDAPRIQTYGAAARAMRRRLTPAITTKAA